MKRGVWIGIGAGVVIIIVAVVLLLGRNKTVAPTKATLTIWSPFDEGQVYQKISQAWLAANPTVTLDFKYVQATDAKDYEAQVVNAIANGTGPDIWLVRSDWLPKHADKSQPAIVTGQTDAVKAAKQTIIPAVVDLNTFNKQLYGVPLFGDDLAIIYNTTLLAEWQSSLSGAQLALSQKFPTTWDDLKNQIAIFSQSKNGIVSRSALALGTTANTANPSDVLGAFLVQNGVTSILSSDNQSVAFNLPKVNAGLTSLPAIEALSFYTSFATPGASNFSWTTNLGDPVTAFLNQKTDALIGYSSTLQQIVNKNPSFTIGVAPLVQPKVTPGIDRVDYGVTWSHLVAKNSPRPSLAWNYLGFLMGIDVQADYINQTGRLTVAASRGTTELGTSLAQAAIAKNQVFYPELATVQQLTNPEWQFTSQVLQDTINLVINSGQSAQTAVDSAAARFKTQFLSGQ
ncbi:MAG TPA: hypothetical protein VLE93_00260 [Candidatus Saccharimonadales bacterium]|nr:hypothetical protein [Candidatus Saccharimonadales bacterium]